jgi:PiT family inorganic phosphate transporter
MTIILVFTLFLIGCSIFVNGWTDAPNAIATVVSTRVMHPKAAIMMGAFFNFLGVFLMGSAVAMTTSTIISISSGSEGLVTLASAQLAIVLWAVGAWRFGIPTSESHALVAGLMGAGMSLNGFAALNMDKVGLVFGGLFISVIVGLLGGYFGTKLVAFIFKKVKRKTANTFFSRGQLVSAMLMAFAHGAQDGQKFMGVMVLALIVGGVIPPMTNGMVIPIWIMISASALMAFGTSIGGYRIIKTMGMDMVKLEKYQGFTAELIASVSLLMATTMGVPLSTTNSKATAMMGAGASRGINKVDWGIAKEMIAAWVLTFPACMLLAYVFATLLRAILL